MSEKSHVSLGQKFCPICGKTFDDGTILLETRLFEGKLMQTLDKHTVTGVELCPEHLAMVESDEYVAFFVCKERDCAECKDPTKRGGMCGRLAQKECDAHHYKQGGVYMYRTGAGFLLKKTTADGLFNCPVARVNHCDAALQDEILSRVRPVPDSNDIAAGNLASPEGESHE